MRPCATVCDRAKLFMWGEEWSPTKQSISSKLLSETASYS